MMNLNDAEKAIAEELAGMLLSGTRAISKPRFLNLALKHIGYVADRDRHDPMNVPASNPEAVYVRFLHAGLIEEQSPPDAEAERNIPPKMRSTVKLATKLLDAVEEPADGKLDTIPDNPLLNETDKAVMAIAGDHAMDLEEKMRRILSISNEAVGWTSNKWADLLRVTPGRIRQTGTWKMLQEKKNAPD